MSASSFSLGQIQKVGRHEVRKLKLSNGMNYVVRNDSKGSRSLFTVRPTLDGRVITAGNTWTDAGINMIAD